jgi:hypothetical protein
LQGGFGGEPLGDQPNAETQDAENDHYRPAKNSRLLLA